MDYHLIFFPKFKNLFYRIKMEWMSHEESLGKDHLPSKQLETVQSRPRIKRGTVCYTDTCVFIEKPM